MNAAAEHTSQPPSIDNFTLYAIEDKCDKGPALIFKYDGPARSWRCRVSLQSDEMHDVPLGYLRISRNSYGGYHAIWGGYEGPESLNLFANDVDRLLRAALYENNIPDREQIRRVRLQIDRISRWTDSRSETPRYLPACAFTSSDVLTAR